VAIVDADIDSEADEKTEPQEVVTVRVMVDKP
jgi:hypothetical protein